MVGQKYCCEELKQQSDGSASGKMSNSVSSMGKEVSSTQGRGLRRSLLFKRHEYQIPLVGEFLLLTESGRGLKENKDIPLLIIFKV